MKKLVVLGMCLCIVFAFTSCKSSEKSYRQAYERAKQQEMSDPRMGSPVEISSSVTEDIIPIDYSQSSEDEIEISAVELDPVEMPPADLTPVVSETPQNDFSQPSYGNLPSYNSTGASQESVSYAGAYGTPPAYGSSYGSAPSYSSSSRSSSSYRRSSSRGGGYREYSVVCGSFGMKSNAERMRNFLSAEGYNATVVYAPEMAMYRVIIGTYSDRYSAVQARDAFKSKYSYRRELQNAWVLGSR